LRRRERAIVAPLAAAIIAIGFFPKPLIDVIDDGVQPILTEVGESDPAPVVEGGSE
jgi:NADH-quinone oxidoreductase subunit M